MSVLTVSVASNVKFSVSVKASIVPISIPTFKSDGEVPKAALALKILAPST